MLISWNWLKEYLGEETELSAQQAADLLGTHAFEIEDVQEEKKDTIIEVDILPNRASDSLCHRGIARELSSITGVALAHDPLTADPDLSNTGSKLSLTVEDGADCARFTAAVVEGVKVKESPKWLKQALEAMGQRSINNVVDATNYVMFSIGQPTHAFDYDKLSKNADDIANITVRRGAEGETLTLLTGEEIEADENILHLVDGNNNALLDLAGIKGGQAAELTKDTVNIAITSGNFNYQLVRKTAQRLKVFTDASTRFQNEPSPELAGYGLIETVNLILELAGGELDGYVQEYLDVRTIPTTVVSTENVNALLGLDLSQDQIIEFVTRIGAKVEVTSEGALSCTPPWERTDLNIEEDYIEEIGRLHGYAHVEAVVPEKVALTEINQRHVYSEKIRDVLTGLGFSEVITSSFRKKDKLQLRNALASDKSYLRSSLSKNITEALEKNGSYMELLGLPDVRVFEIGTVFTKDGEGIVEHTSLALGARVKKKSYSPKDDELVKEAITKLEEALGTSINADHQQGVIEINLTQLLATVAVESEYQAVEVGEEIVYQPFSQYQHVSRDIAMWVPNSGEDMKKVIKDVIFDASGKLGRRVTLIDEFEKDGRTSYAFRIIFQSFERTLTDGEVNGIMETIYDTAKEQKWEVR